MKKIIISSVILVILSVSYYYISPYVIQPSSVHKEISDISTYTPASTSTSVTLFKEIPIDFNHSYNKDFYAFAGSALIDVNGDGVEELFIGGGQDQIDGLFKFENNQFTNIATEWGFTNKTAAGGALAIDFDNNKTTDLLVSRLDGVYLYLNDGTKFTEQKLNIIFEKDAVPLSLSVTDINKDGLADLYVSTFKDPRVFKFTTFNKPSNRSANLMLLNKGNNVFEDITQKSGLTYKQNTFQASFVDLNNDTWPDLVLSPNTDKVIVYENKKDGTFEVKPPLTNFGFWMGLAVGDIDNDGDQDFFLSNIGNSVPNSAARGDLLKEQVLDSEWAMIRNDGNFTFTNVTTLKKLNDYEFGWGALFEDLNLDGRLDLLVSENYIKLPAHRINKLDGRVFLQEFDGGFLSVTKAVNLTNPHYGTSPLLADFNKDGYPDVVFINFNGQSYARLSIGGDNNYLKVFLSDTATSLGARVDVRKLDGTILSKQVIGGIGLLTDISNELIFGLGADIEVKEVVITLVSGKVQRFQNVKAGTTLKIK